MAIELDMDRIGRHQRNLAELAVAGDHKSLEVLGKNHGCYDWRGDVDFDKARACAQRILAGELYG